MSASKLFDPYKLGNVTLTNRAVMAPLTRNRAVAGFVPNPLAIEYYGQRASAGLLITEASQVSQQGQGYQDTPGIYIRGTCGLAQGDRPGARARRPHLHSALACRTHLAHQPAGQRRCAGRAIRDPRQHQDLCRRRICRCPEPRALELGEIPGIIDSFKRASANALEAGFDGVEIHGANGYLLDQFAKDGTNKRTDAYGGSIEYFAHA